MEDSSLYVANSTRAKQKAFNVRRVDWKAQKDSEWVQLQS